jgi:hypothetical protein
MNIKYSFTVMVKLNLSHEKNKEHSQHNGTECNLEISENLDSKKYCEENGLPNKEGCKAITETLIQGLVANIHFAHQKNYRDSAEHLRDIIRKIEDGFIQIGEIEEDETDLETK